MGKRGQVAMEFLMTYGWAIIIILLAIAALWLLGVFSPSVSTTCQIDAPFICQDAVISKQGITLKVAASQIQSGSINSITINGQACPKIVNGQLTPLKVTTVVCPGLTLEENEKVSVAIGGQYIKRGGGLTHNIDGTLSGQAAKDHHLYGTDERVIVAYDFENEAEDVSGNNNDGTVTGTNCNAQGKVGKGCQLDGTVNQYIILNPIKNFPSTDITVAFFMKSSDTTKTGTPISYAVSGQDNEFLIFDYKDFSIYINGDASGGTGVSGNDGIWHHITVTWQSSDGEVKVFKDGIQIYTGTLKQGYNIINDGALVVGQEQDSVGGGFNPSQAFLGTIDEIVIYNEVITLDEIQTLSSL